MVCDLSAIPAEQRAEHETFAAQLLFESVLELRELADGYALRFSADAYTALAKFIANERLCCPFFSFVLEVTPQHGPLWLRLTGGDGVKELLRTMLQK
jgi:hypothetical protein